MLSLNIRLTSIWNLGYSLISVEPSSALLNGDIIARKAVSKAGQIKLGMIVSAVIILWAGCIAGTVQPRMAG